MEVVGLTAVGREEKLISRDELQYLSSWTSSNLQSLQATLIQRHKEGFIRECHGDLHLRNLVRLRSGIVAFDCVEFSSDLRNIDVMSDVSFLLMDLVARERQDLAYLFINRYLECTGDYAGMPVFGLYYVYHALIRAKIAAIRSVERTDETDRTSNRFRNPANLAPDWVEYPVAEQVIPLTVSGE